MRSRVFLSGPAKRTGRGLDQTPYLCADLACACKQKVAPGASNQLQQDQSACTRRKADEIPRRHHAGRAMHERDMFAWAPARVRAAAQPSLKELFLIFEDARARVQGRQQRRSAPRGRRARQNARPMSLGVRRGRLTFPLTSYCSPLDAPGRAARHGPRPKPDNVCRCAHNDGIKHCAAM